MKNRFSTVLACLSGCAFALSLSAGSFGCGETEELIDCADICAEADSCLDNFDYDGCVDSCEDQPQSEIDDCDACLDDSEMECTQCGAACAALLT